MEFEACLNILSQREQHSHVTVTGNEDPVLKSCVCCTEIFKTHKELGSEEKNESGVNDTLEGLTNLELVQLFTTLQGERVSVSISRSVPNHFVR